MGLYAQLEVATTWTSKMRNNMAQDPKTESIGSNYSPKSWTLHCLHSLLLGYWAVILQTLEAQVSPVSLQVGARC